MLRSELKTRRTWTDDARVRTLTLITVLCVIGAVGTSSLVYCFHDAPPRTQGHAEVSGTQATRSLAADINSFGFVSGNLNTITTEGHPFTDSATFVGDAYKNIAVFDPNSNRELATVHTQARTPRRFDARASTKIGDHITWDEKQRADFCLQCANAARRAESRDCAAGCADADECLAVVVVDGFNHVELDLPCVNGKVGTWQVTKLP